MNKNVPAKKGHVETTENAAKEGISDNHGTPVKRPVKQTKKSALPAEKSRTTKTVQENLPSPDLGSQDSVKLQPLRLTEDEFAFINSDTQGSAKLQRLELTGIGDSGQHSALPTYNQKGANHGVVDLTGSEQQLMPKTPIRQEATGNRPDTKNTPCQTSESAPIVIEINTDVSNNICLGSKTTRASRRIRKLPPVIKFRAMGRRLRNWRKIRQVLIRHEVLQ